MTILTREEAKRVLTKVVGMSKAEGCSVRLGGGREGNIRYARNSVTTAGMIEDTSLSVTSNFGKRQGAASLNQLDDALVRDFR